jgi:hypothetical protein
MSQPIGNTAETGGDNNSPLDSIKNTQLRQEFDRLMQEAIRLEKVAEHVDNSTKQLLGDRYRLNHAFDTRIEATIQLGQDAEFLGQYVKQHRKDVGLIQPLPDPLEQLITQHK